MPMPRRSPWHVANWQTCPYLRRYFKHALALWRATCLPTVANMLANLQTPRAYWGPSPDAHRSWAADYKICSDLRESSPVCRLVSGEFRLPYLPLTTNHSPLTG